MLAQQVDAIFDVECTPTDVVQKSFQTFADVGNTQVDFAFGNASIAHPSDIFLDNVQCMFKHNTFLL